MCNLIIRPVSHNLDLPLSKPPTEKDCALSVDEYASTGTESEEDFIESDSSFQYESSQFLTNQKRMNVLIGDLYLSKRKQKF